MLDKKNLIFDLGGVLLDIDPAATISAMEAIGVKKTLISDGLNLKNSILLDFEKGLLSSEELCKYIASSMGRVCNEELFVKIRQAWCAMLCNVSEEKFRCLHKLREKGYKVYLLSNTNTIHWNVVKQKIYSIENRTLDYYFDNVYLSFEMHCCKPDTAIFEKLLAKENIIPNDALFFDDSLENCNAAASLGIKAQIMERNATWPQWLTRL